VASPRDGGPAVDWLVTWTTNLLARRGVDITFGSKIGDLLRGAGLSPVYAHAIPPPIGTYGGRVGTMQARDFVSVQKSLGGPYVASSLTTDAEFTQTLANCTGGPRRAAVSLRRAMVHLRGAAFLGALIAYPVGRHD